MMAKMRLEEKQMANKFRKEKGLPELDETEKAAPTFTRQRRGRDDRKDGARGQRGGRGRGRGAMPPPGPVPIPPQMMGGMGGMGQMGGMGPFVPGDFRTPPFPGLEGEFRNKRFKKTSCSQITSTPFRILPPSWIPAQLRSWLPTWYVAWGLPWGPHGQGSWGIPKRREGRASCWFPSKGPCPSLHRGSRRWQRRQGWPRWSSWGLWQTSGRGAVL